MEPSDRQRGTRGIRFGLPFLPGWRGELLILAFLGLATIVLTWPIAITLDQATGLRGDYFNNLWNAWWLGRSIASGQSPFETDLLFHPEGLSLWRHTLSPINAGLGALLSTLLSPHAVFNVVLLVNFLLSAWTFSLFARYVTGSTEGSILAGMLYSFCPFHYYYICQVNVFSIQWLPLALLFFARVYREGGWRNGSLAALFTGCIAASSEYYVMYAVFAVGLMLAFGKLLDPGVRWREGAARLVASGLVTGLAVAIAAFPLLFGTLFADAEAAGGGMQGVQAKRANDLLGYEWVGAPESLTLSYMSALGYSTLLLLLVAARRIFCRLGFWLVLGAFFFVLGLGRELEVMREPRGIPLLYGLLEYVPGLEMLRKPDRAFLMVQFVAALAFAEAWCWLAERIPSVRGRAIAWTLALVLPMVELTGVPFHRFDYEPPAYSSMLRGASDVDAIVDVPPEQMDIMNARYLFFQMTHGKKQALGYCTVLAKEKRQEHLMTGIVNSYWAYAGGYEGHMIPDFPADFPTWVRSADIDLVILHKTRPRQRPPERSVVARVVFEPFFLVRRELMYTRQVGQFLDQPQEERNLIEQKARLRRAFGDPIHEDAEVVVFDPRGGPR